GVGGTLFHLRIRGLLLETGAAHGRDTAAVAHAEGHHLEALLPGQFPDIRRRLIGDSAARHQTAVLRITERPCTLSEFGRVGRGRPGLTVLRYFTAAIQVVEQHELLGQRVLVRRDIPPEERQGRIAVPLFQIAVHLVVSAVLFHDEQDVLYRRSLT